MNAHQLSILTGSLLWTGLLPRAVECFREMGKIENGSVDCCAQSGSRFSKASMRGKGRLPHFQFLQSQNYIECEALWVLTLMAEKQFLAILYTILSLEMI